MTVVASAELTSLGRISLTIPGRYSISAARRPISMTTLRRVDDQAYDYVRGKLVAIEKHYSNRLKAQVLITGGMVASGSIKFEEGKLVVTSVALAALITAGGFVANYESLRKGVVLIYQDVSLGIDILGKTLGLEGLSFAPEPPEKVLTEVSPFLTPEQRRFVQPDWKRYS